MNINKIQNLSSILLKEAQQRRRIVPKWLENRPEQTEDVETPIGESGFLGSFDQFLDGSEISTNPTSTNPTNEFISTPPPPPSSATIPKDKKVKPKTEEQLLKEYWEDKPKADSGYKPSFLGDFDPHSVPTGTVKEQLPKITREPDYTPLRGGDAFSAYQKDIDEKKRKERELSTEKETETLLEKETFEKAKERLSKIDDEIKNSMNKAKQLLIIPKLFGKAELIFKNQKSPLEDRPPSELIKAFKSVKDAGGDAKMVKVEFPKTPYTEKFISWVLANVDASSVDIIQTLIEVQKLHANKKDIENSIKLREERLNKKVPTNFDQFFR